MNWRDQQRRTMPNNGEQATCIELTTTVNTYQTIQQGIQTHRKNCKNHSTLEIACLLMLLE